MKVRLLVLLLFSSFLLVNKTNAQCFQIESILVDACGNPEGENEMVRLKIGNSPLNVSTISIVWPSNLFLGMCQNATTASLVATLNGTITACGYIKEPVGGVLPANSTVILATSTALNPAFNSFANLNDTVYMIFQCAGNTAGHFKNYASGAGPRTLSISFGACTDIATYVVDSLTTSAGTYGSEEGETVNFTAGGQATYTSPGCVAPIVPFTSEISSGALPLCNGANLSLQAIISSSSYQTIQWSSLHGTVIPGNTVNSSYHTNGTYTGNESIFLKVITLCGDTLIDTLNFQVNPGPTVSINASGPLTFCPGDSVTLSAVGTGSFQWSNGSTSSSIVVKTAGTYTVTLTNPCGTTTASVSASIGGNVTATITPQGNTNLCPGDSVLLTATGGTSYLWSNGSTSASTYAIAGVSTANITVTVTNACGSASDFETITVLPLPTAGITPGGLTTICPGDSVLLTANGNGSFQWSNGATTTNIYAKAAGVYTLTVTNSCGSATANISISVGASPTAGINAAGSTALCPGASVTLDAQGTGSYLWSNGSTASSITVSTASNYILTVTNGCGSASANITVTSLPAPAVTIAPAGAQQICAGQSIGFTAAGNGNFNWSTGASGSNINVTTAGTYTVTVTNSCGTSSAQVSVSVNNPPTATLNASSLVICPGSPETLFAGGGGNYVWSNGQTSSSIQVTSAGTFTVTVSNNCGSDIASLALTQNPIQALFTADTTEGAAPFTVHFTDQSINNVSWSWSFGDSTFANDTNPTHQFLSDGTYIVTLRVGDGLGCYDEYKDTIYVRSEENVTVPNAFSPNADNTNDIFNIIGFNISKIDGMIFNRWGQLIYSWDESKPGWDGKVEGTEAPQGTYFYVIHVDFDNGTSRQLRGTVTLLR